MADRCTAEPKAADEFVELDWCPPLERNTCSRKDCDSSGFERNFVGHCLIVAGGGIKLRRRPVTGADRG